MSTLDSRLTTLEQRHEQARGIKGIRIFQESHDTVGVFYEVSRAPHCDGDQGYTDGDIHLLAEMGWTVIKAMYIHDWCPTE